MHDNVKQTLEEQRRSYANEIEMSAVELALWAPRAVEAHSQADEFYKKLMLAKVCDATCVALKECTDATCERLKDSTDASCTALKDSTGAICAAVQSFRDASVERAKALERATWALGVFTLVLAAVTGALVYVTFYRR